MFCYLGMNFQIEILFFVTVIIERAFANQCGKTTSRQDGNTATITYYPNLSVQHQLRTWLYRSEVNHRAVEIGIRSTASRPTRFTEQFDVGSNKYILTIHNVTNQDSGLYNVRCCYDGSNAIYSETATLNIHITRAPKTTTTTSSLKPSTKVTTVSVTTPIVPTAETSRNTETEETSQQRETDDSALIVPVIGGVAGTLALVVVCALLLTVYHKRCKKQELKSPVESKAKRTIIAHLLGDNEGTEKTLSTEEIPEYASVKLKDKRKCAEKTVDGSDECPEYSKVAAKSERISDAKNNVQEKTADGSDECPEYSKVAPKSERTSDAKNNVQTKSICETTEAANNQLVYAELDLELPKANTKDTERHQETDHVEIGLSKTRSSHDSKRVTEQLEQTEYVTIDFSKTDQVN